jgi:hypothetical protein
MAMIVREAEGQKQLYEEGVAVPRPEPGSLPGSARHPGSPELGVTGPSAPVSMALSRSTWFVLSNRSTRSSSLWWWSFGAKVTLTLEIEAEASDGFADGDVIVVRDNARQLKFKSESTGFNDLIVLLPRLCL